MPGYKRFIQRPGRTYLHHMIRTRIDVHRPSFSGSYAETWRVTVDQVKQPWGWDFMVQGTFVAEHVPQQYDTEKHAWVEAHDREIPGLFVPAEAVRYPSLVAARDRARSVADVLDGRPFPEWKAVHFDLRGNVQRA